MPTTSDMRLEEGIGPGSRRRLSGFVRALRDNGFAVGLAETGDAARVLASPGADRASTLKPAFRALFAANKTDWKRFDRIFEAYWQGRGMRQSRVTTGAFSNRALSEQRMGVGQAPMGTADRAQRGEGPEGAAPADDRGRRGGASRTETLARLDARRITDPEDIAAAHELAERLARRMRTRLVRRQRARARGRRIDLRRTIHRNISHGGTPIDLVWRQRKTKPLRLVILLDASGSMSLYTAFFLRFMHGVVDSFREAEAFVFHTRLAHVSPSLRERDAERALQRLALLAEGIGGGTRIGESLATFNRWHAARVIHSRTAVMIVSDGYDTGEPQILAQEMDRLRHRCRRIVWLNPLIGWEGYAPEARGMQAALPYVDLFAAAHNLESLAALEPYLARI